MPKNLLDVLREVKNDPVRLVGEKSLADLEAFLNGFFRSFALIGPEQGKTTEKCKLGKSFSWWVARRYGLPITKRSFSTIALLTASSSEAFDRYFQELNEFLEDPAEKAIETLDFRTGLMFPEETILDVGSELERIRQYPFDCLNGRSVLLLRSYLNGFIFGPKAFGLQVRCKPDLEQFSSWLQASFASIQVKPALRWERILGYITDREENEARAFDLFFEMFDRWLTATGPADAVAKPN